MSSVMENRDAVFTNQPQAVEVYESGAWWPGELLGWRHDASGACQVRVRAVVEGVQATGWTDLSTLRLPEPPSAPRPVQEFGGRPAEAPRRRRADAERTASLPLARDHAVAEAAPVRTGGRRRAPEDAHVQPAPAAAVPVPAPGRHRAPSTDPHAGRHRDADTELFQAIVDEPAPSSRQRREDLLATSAWSVPAARPAPAEESVSDTATWRGPADELLTRPMRLSDQVAQPRRPRLMAH
ncbi:hypothetical protein DQ237_03875 [Blastococcus sp. TF02-8]|uniref:hypothetical protein n=1 Tax=Blastococcus sp. TF02-8 TaxID=2250574 RepID=UPI000DFB2B82|nr:hypothetical protein [Blastococcus sp. TF02-8]RBY98038.1 hypothetical protein DQ237_03875 [Blastococcus sp. TF02-8]